MAAQKENEPATRVQTMTNPCSASYLGTYIRAEVRSSTKTEPVPICEIGTRNDIKHFVRVENYVKIYDIKVTCRGTMRNYQGCVEFTCETDDRVTSDNWPDTEKWVASGRYEEFHHVSLRGLSAGSERIDLEVEAAAVDGWLRETFPTPLTIHVTSWY